METLETLVSKHSSKPKTFDYDTFEENSGISKTDQVTLKDALIAFDETSISLKKCLKKSNKPKKKEPENSGLLKVGLGIGALYLLNKFFSPS